MLEKTAHELHSVKGEFFPLVIFASLIFKGDFSVMVSQNPIVCNSNTVDIACQVLDNVGPAL